MKNGTMHTGKSVHACREMRNGYYFPICMKLSIRSITYANEIDQPVTCKRCLAMIAKREAKSHQHFVRNMEDLIIAAERI